MFDRLLSVLALATCAHAQYYGYEYVDPYNNNNQTYGSYKTDTQQQQSNRRLQLEVYYESLCPDSILMYTTELIPVMRRLSQYIDLRTYPYGKATTYVQNGVISFKCQHGEAECYGNKLHVCVIDQIPSWLEFNGCLLTGRSNDTAVDYCARMFNIDPEPIKACAKSDRGSLLLKYFGDESSKVRYNYVPWTVINGRYMDYKTKLMTAVSKELGIADQ